MEVAGELTVEVATVLTVEAGALIVEAATVEVVVHCSGGGCIRVHGCCREGREMQRGGRGGSSWT